MHVSTVAVKRKVRWTTGVFFFLSGLIITTWTSRIPEIQQKFDLSNAELGWVLFAINAGLVGSLPFTSWIIARFTAARMMAFSALIYVLLLPLLALSPLVSLLIILLFLFGSSRTLLSMSANTRALEIQRLYAKPIIAKFHGVWSLACFVGIGAGAFMIANEVSPLVHFSGVALVITLAVLYFKQKRKPLKLQTEKRPLFVKPNLYLFMLGLIIFFSMSCESAMFDWSINYFDKVIKAEKEWVTAGYSAFIIMFTIGRLVGDKLIDRFGSFTMLWVNGLIMAAGFFIAIVFPSVWASSIGFLLVGFGGSIIVPVVYSLAGETKVMLPTYAIVSVTMIGYAGFLTCPLLMGFLSEHWGMQSAFALMAVYAGAISVLVFVMQKFKISA